MGNMIVAQLRTPRLIAYAIVVIPLILLALLQSPDWRSSLAAFDAASNRLKVAEKPGYGSQVAGRKPELLYVLDSNMMKADSQILLIDPQSGKSLRSFKAHRAPDFILSKDGSRLYIDSLLESSFGGVLEVVDTATGQTLASVASPDHWTCTLHIYDTNMALSHDGKWLYVFKHRQEDNAYYIAIFDTVNNRFLPGNAMLPDCVAGEITPSPDNNLHITVTCHATIDIRRLNFNEDGSSAGTVERSEPRKARLAAKRPSRKLGIDDYPAVTLPISDSKAAIITSNGDTFDFDRANMITTFSHNLDAAHNRDPMSSTWLSNRWIRPQPIHYSPGDQLVYFGTGKVSYKNQGRSDLFDQVEVIKSKTMTHIRSITPPRTFFSLAVSEDGKTIYTVSHDDATVTLIDSSTSAELKVIKNVGVSPIQAIVSR